VLINAYAQLLRYAEYGIFFYGTLQLGLAQIKEKVTNTTINNTI
jgi:hypothetical protein